ncbi:MAG: alpha/beta hydrolase, partial [Asgard group archaeon]|nr:alpha/beta hydrolase [Asgard group archaeon]
MENGKIIIGEHFEIKSKIQDEKRLILVSLPKGYERTKINYPVIFILNASWEMNFIKNASTVHYLYGSGLNPNMIVVGICDTDYNRDFLPHLGGSDRFLEFIKEELIPFIDQRFRTATFRILYGQSNAGLLTTYALLTQPEIFDAYIASSPMIGWDKEIILEKVKLFNKMKLKGRKDVYFNSGSEADEQVHERLPYLLE